MIETSSDLPRNSRTLFRKVLMTFGQLLDNRRKVVGNIHKIVKKVVISMLI